VRSVARQVARALVYRMQRIVAGDMPICKSRHAQVAATPGALIILPRAIDRRARTGRISCCESDRRPARAALGIRKASGGSVLRFLVERNQSKLIRKPRAAVTKINDRTSDRAIERARCSERVETARRRDSRGLESRNVAIAEMPRLQGRPA